VSLGLALAFVLVLLAVQFRSLKFGLIGVSPLVLTLLVNFGVMGYGHIPLDDATLMIAPLAIGIGVDYAIHFTSRFRRELARHARVADALLETYRTTGVAILINALSVGLGFVVLLFGDVVPVQRFGLLVALAMLVSAGAALTLLPALLLVSHMTNGKQQESAG
ncbi:MAG: MMPL family transporter, partial [Calditrichaeota bacterium]|nr:MMPL family transporter [Calditrichota bacterium]